MNERACLITRVVFNEILPLRRSPCVAFSAVGQFHLETKDDFSRRRKEEKAGRRKENSRNYYNFERLRP